MRKLKPNYNQCGVYFVTPQVLRFESNYEMINDEDINDLFMGLVGLIRKSENIKIERYYSNIINKLKQEIDDLKKSELI